MNNIFCNHIRRCCLCSKDHCDRCGRFVARFDVQIFVDCIKCIHLLTFILMKTFYLYINDGMFINSQSLGFFHVFFEFQFLFHLDFFQLVQHCFIIFKSQQFFQFCGIFLESVSDQRFNISGQYRITMHQPATERDSVCFVVKTFRIEVIEIFQF